MVGGSKWMTTPPDPFTIQSNYITGVIYNYLDVITSKLRDDEPRKKIKAIYDKDFTSLCL
jgi:hypothetical protein